MYAAVFRVLAVIAIGDRSGDREVDAVERKLIHLQGDGDGGIFTGICLAVSDGVMALVLIDIPFAIDVILIEFQIYA